MPGLESHPGCRAWVQLEDPWSVGMEKVDGATGSTCYTSLVVRFEGRQTFGLAYSTGNLVPILHLGFIPANGMISTRCLEVNGKTLPKLILRHTGYGV